MIKYVLKIGYYDLENEKKILKELVDSYPAKELSKALSLVAGLISECLLTKKAAVDYINFYQLVDGDEYFLFRFSAEEFCSIYILDKNKEENKK